MKRAALILVLCLILVAASLTLAQPGSNVSLNWSTVDGGAARSADSRYSLQSTIGQPDAGAMGNGRYTLLSGYWDGSSEYMIYLPAIAQR